jgi:hypothetical protein
MDYVNSVAEPNAVVTALQAPQAARPFAREDLKVSYEYERPAEESNILLTCSWFVGGYLENDDWQRIAMTQVNQITLAEVYSRIQE